MIFAYLLDKPPILSAPKIPIHDFSRDDSTSVSFRIEPLEVKTGYDSSVPHRHNYYEMFIFQESGGTHEIDFRRHEIKKNGVHFVSPGQVHQVNRAIGTYGSVTRFSRDFIGLNSNHAEKLFELPFLNNSPTPVINLKDDELADILPLLDQLRQESSEKQKHYEGILRSTLMTILLKCHRFYLRENPEGSGQYQSFLYREFRMLLEKNFVELHKVRDFAELMNISEKSLNDSIKKVTGKTVSELIYSRLALESKRLLLHSGLSAKEIAYALNFSDPAHFSKFFKKQTGFSPSQYKNHKR